METITKIIVYLLISVFMFLSMIGTITSFILSQRKLKELENNIASDENAKEIYVEKTIQVILVIMFVGAIATCLRLCGAI